MTSYQDMKQRVHQAMDLVTHIDLSNCSATAVEETLKNCIALICTPQFPPCQDLKRRVETLCSTLFTQCSAMSVSDDVGRKFGKKASSMLSPIKSYTLFASCMFNYVVALELGEFECLSLIIENDSLGRQAQTENLVERQGGSEPKAEPSPKMFEEMFKPVINSAMIQYRRILTDCPAANEAQEVVSRTNRLLRSLEQLQEGLEIKNMELGELDNLVERLNEWNDFLLCVSGHPLAGTNADSGTETGSITEADVERSSNTKQPKKRLMFRLPRLDKFRV